MLRKRSISIRAHRTSYSLEDEFYSELLRIAGRENISVARLITTIDVQREPDTNLSSALRLHILQDLKSTRPDNRLGNTK